MLQKLGDIDLLIENDDMVLDGIGIPQLVTGRSCIVQDIKHMLRDSGLLVQMIAQRDKARRAVLLADIEQAVEADARIRPGTARVTEMEADRFLIEAASLQYGLIEFFM